MVYAASYTVPRYQKTDTDRRRGAKRYATKAWQARINQLKSYEKFEQLCYCNFGPGDKYLTLTYDDDHLRHTRREVMGDVKWFRRQLTLLREPRGERCNYIYVVEHKHGDARWHAHMILNGCGPGDLEEIQRCWRHGNVKVEWFDYSRLDDLRHYLTKEQPDYVGEHMWMTSRGLKRPVVESILHTGDFTLTAPHGAIIKERDQRDNEYGSFQYIKYFIPEN